MCLLHLDKGQRTLIVRGFNKDTTADILELVFEEAGGEDTVENIRMDGTQAVVVFSTKEGGQIACIHFAV